MSRDQTHCGPRDGIKTFSAFAAIQYGIKQLCDSQLLRRALLTLLCNRRLYSNFFSDLDFLGLAHNHRVSDDASMMSRRVPDRRRRYEESCLQLPSHTVRVRTELGQRRRAVLDFRRSWTLRSRLGIALAGQLFVFVFAFNSSGPYQATSLAGATAQKKGRR